MLINYYTTDIKLNWEIKYLKFDSYFVITFHTNLSKS